MKNCTYVFRTVLCLCLLFAGIVPGFSQQIERGLTSTNGDYLGFLEYKPADYSTKTGTKYPLIIFLHGIGERGNGTTDLKNVACCGLPRIIKRGHNMTFTWNGKTETFIVLSPQCPKKYGMWPAAFVNDLIAYAKANLRVDPDRIYLTGLSMGGGGTFKYISTNPEHPKNISAAATICAPCMFQHGEFVADAKMPLWAFHAADDRVALASCTESAIRKINEANPVVKPLKTIWPTGGHGVWDRVYTDTNYRFNGVVNIYEWFLGQNRKWAPNKLPVANAGSTITISSASGVATLNGSASSDPDGKIVRYVWKKIEGPAAGVITNPFGPNSSTTVTGLTTPGTYKYELNVVDDRAAYTNDVVTVVVASGASIDNKIPIAKAGSDVTITLPSNTVKLDGSASSDPDGSIVSYNWSKVSGPNLNIISPNNSTINLTLLTEGTYVFKLKVTDNKGASSDDQVTVTVKPAPAVNKAPIARAGVNFSITLPVNSTTLDGSKSEDEDGSIKTYLWTKVSGPAGGNIESPSLATTKINGLQQGTYVYKLKVTDNSGAPGEDQITVIINAAPNIAPIANAGTDITITLPQNKTTLNGSASSDEDGSIKSYLWTKVSGPGSGSIVNSNAATTEVNALEEGIYQFRLKITDDNGASDEDIVIIKVNPPANIRPIADAGKDITITLPVNKTVLNGSKSSDPDGSISEYDWSKISGPSSFSIADATVASTNLSNLSEGTYKFKLQISDNKGASASDTVVVTVLPAPPPPNVAPVAEAGADKTIALPLNEISLDGSSSMDGDGTISQYSWSFVDGPESFIIAEPNAAKTTVSGLAAGSYRFRLEVVDNDGASDNDTIVVVVKEEDVPPPPPNRIPVAIAGEDITITLPLNEVTVDGTRSDDADGTLINYSWMKISGPNQYTISKPNYHITTIENLTEGVYTFRLQVKDNSGALGYDTIQVTVLPEPNKVPVSKAGPDQQIQLPVDGVQLNGSDSYDPDGDVVKYQWEYVSGPSAPAIESASSKETIVGQLTSGEYLFRLTVTDNSGAPASDVVKITVLPEAPNQTPVAKAGEDMIVQLPNPQISLDGSASFDPDGTIESFSWVKAEGPGGVTIVNSTTAKPTIVGVVEGEYLFRLTVTDNKGKPASDVVKIVVKAAPPIPNQTPIAYAGEDQELAFPQSTTKLDGSLSNDTDGSLVSFEWHMISGPASVEIVSPHESATDINSLQTGEYIFELVIRDNGGAENRDTVHVSVINTMRYEEVMNVFPNPAVSGLNVQLTSDTMGMTRIAIFNMTGSLVKTVYREKTQAQLFENVNISTLQTGIYYVEVMISGKLRRISKFVKR